MARRKPKQKPNRQGGLWTPLISKMKRIWLARKQKLGIRKPAALRGVAKPIGDTTHTQRSDVSADVPIPAAPFFGSRVVDDIALDDVFSFVNETALIQRTVAIQAGTDVAG